MRLAIWLIAINVTRYVALITNVNSILIVGLVIMELLSFIICLALDIREILDKFYQ